jgi:hypothetical protein
VRLKLGLHLGSGTSGRRFGLSVAGCGFSVDLDGAVGGSAVAEEDDFYGEIVTVLC